MLGILIMHSKVGPCLGVLVLVFIVWGSFFHVLAHKEFKEINDLRFI